VLYHCTPVYEDLAGWLVDISEVRSWSRLPAAARTYVERVEALAGVPIRLISVGPQRSATFEKP
jgi:adenylosuccinate synthase